MDAIKLLLLSIAISSVDSQFLPIKEDPADALVDKMIKGAGIDSADSTLGSAKLGVMSWKAPTLQDETPKAQIDHNRFNQHDLVKLQPVVSVTGLAAPKEWEATPEMQASTQNKQVQSALANDKKFIAERNGEFYHEIVSKHQPQSNGYDGEELQKPIASKVDQELQNLKPKEVIKVLDRDTTVDESAYKTMGGGLAHLGETLDKYGPVTQEKTIDPNFSVHHGSFRPTAAPTLYLPATTEAMVADATDETRSPTRQVQEDDLTSSLKAMFPKQKNVAERSLTGKTSTDKVPGHSVMDSVHHSKRSIHSIRFPIRPEDVHHEESTNSTSQSHLNASTASTVNNTVKQHDHKTVVKLKGHRRKSSSKKPSDKLTNLFDANSDSGQLGADDVEKVLRFMKVQSGWNWHPFDLNGDGKLSRQEFLNAARVAQHFIISKK